MIQHKVCLVGAYAVGKTSLAGRFTQGRFSDRYLATLGVRIDRKTLVVDDREVKFIVWDMAGEDEFAKVNMSYLVGASGYLLVIDGTRRVTFDQGMMLEQRVRDSVGPLPFVVLVNKCDREAAWEITAGDLKDMEARHWVVQRTSAKTGDGVDLSFQTLVRQIDRLRGNRFPGKV